MKEKKKIIFLTNINTQKIQHKDAKIQKILIHTLPYLATSSTSLTL